MSDADDTTRQLRLEDALLKALDLIANQTQLIGKLAVERNGRIPVTVERYLPSDKRHRTYRGFKTVMIEYEQLVKKDGRRVTKAAIYTLVGLLEKTQSRTMAAFGLNPRAWPPSAWPEHAPNGKEDLEAD